MSKVKEEELNKLKDIQKRYEEFAYNLGKVELSLIRFNNEKEHIKSQISKLEVEEINFANSLKDQYGDIIVDLNTGELKKTE